jgi:hypothetical protein
MGRPQQTFWTIATLPHFPQRNPAMAPSLLAYRARLTWSASLQNAHTVPVVT